MQQGLAVIRKLARRAGLLPPAPPTIQRTHLTAAMQRRVIQALALLAPFDTPGLARRRIGGGGDGGYVLADCLTPSQPVLSLGIGPDLSFDAELADEGHQIVMLDHTIDALPQTHPNFTWLRCGIAAADSAEAELAAAESAAAASTAAESLRTA